MLTFIQRINICCWENNSKESLFFDITMKYNNTVEYKDLKLQERIRSGEYNLKVNGQQNKHILEHHDYRSGRSYLLDGVDAQELVNKYAGD